MTRRKRRRRSSRPDWLTFALLFSVGALIYWAFSSQRLTQPEVHPPVYTAALAVRPALAPLPARPIYPYSVIRGGAYSPAEFDAALRLDSVIFAHYSRFHRESLRFTPAPYPMPMYASYRIGNSIYWTSHPVHVAAGETLITDGASLARARCGNQLSNSPRRPITRMEPMERELETPEALDLSPHPPANSSTLDRLLALTRPSEPTSALLFELFPPAQLPAAPETQNTYSNNDSRALPVQTPSPFLAPVGILPAYAFPPPPSLPPSPVAQSVVVSSDDVSQSIDSNLQLVMETFQSTKPPSAISENTEVSPPIFPGLITDVETFHDNPPGFGVTETNPQKPPETTSYSPPFTSTATPGNLDAQSGNTGSSLPGDNAVPEPVAGVLICAGLAFLWIAARRLNPSSR
jgi:hypothetical protein